MNDEERYRRMIINFRWILAEMYKWHVVQSEILNEEPYIHKLILENIDLSDGLNI